MPSKRQMQESVNHKLDNIPSDSCQVSVLGACGEYLDTFPDS